MKITIEIPDNPLVVTYQVVYDDPNAINMRIIQNVLDTAKLKEMQEDCKHYYESVSNEPCSSCIEDTETKKNWQWSGVCPENTKEGPSNESQRP